MPLTTITRSLFTCQDIAIRWFLTLTWTSGQEKGSSSAMNAQENWCNARSFSISAHFGIGLGPLTGCHTKASGCKEQLANFHMLVTKHNTVRLRRSPQPAVQVLKLGLGQWDVKHTHRKSESKQTESKTAGYWSIPDLLKCNVYIPAELKKRKLCQWSLRRGVPNSTLSLLTPPSGGRANIKLHLI